MTSNIIDVSINKAILYVGIFYIFIRPGEGSDNRRRGTGTGSRNITDVLKHCNLCQCYHDGTCYDLQNKQYECKLCGYRHNGECPTEADVAMKIVNDPILPVLTPHKGKSGGGRRLFVSDRYNPT